MWVHNHPPNEPPCRERDLPGGGVRGECLPDGPVRRCATCGRPQNDHPVRHPFKMPRLQVSEDFIRRMTPPDPPLCERELDPMGTE